MEDWCKLMNKEDMKAMAVILNKANAEQLIALQQFLNAVVIDRVALANQQLGLVREVAEEGEEETKED